ncbi:MAG TPA: hypothetical protein VME66_13525 [Candidatus Acidoferrales bacterium]|nr:hypothetical protein [Candidatus Acidoferrales bacterium]
MYSLVLLGCLILTWMRLRRGGSGPFVPTFRNWGLRGVAAAGVALAALFAARLALVYLADLDPRGPAWLRHLPIVAIRDQHDYWYDPHRQVLAAAVGLTAVGSGVALYVLYGSLQSRRRRGAAYAVVTLVALLMSFAAVTAPGVGTTDPYLYAAYGELGLGAYSAVPLHVPCAASTVQRWCSGPKLPALYGPLYLAYVHALLHGGGPILLRIQLLRLSNLCWFALLLVLLRTLQLPGPVIALVAVNPVVYAQYISDAHNDVIAVSATLAAIAAAPRWPFAGFLGGVAAALVKLPFALLAAVIFLRLPLKRRLSWTVATAASGIALTLVWGGLPYLASVAYYRTYYPFFSNVPQCCVDVIALGLLLVALLRRRISLAGAYAIPALGAGPTYPWYAFWSLPYIVWEPATFALYLIALPVTAFLTETPFQMPLLWVAIPLALLGLAIRELVRPTPEPSPSVVG